MDVTSKLEILGIPFTKEAYARNVWDMQIYKDRIYLGSGDSGKDIPPDGVVYLDTNTKRFVNQFKVDEEQIACFKIIDGQLYIPGSDPIEDWTLGNFYRLENDNWIKYRTIPNGVHNMDMESFGGALFTAIGTTVWNTVPISYDNGKTWGPIDSAVNKSFSEYSTTARTLFKFKNKLYAVNQLFNANNVQNKLLCVEQVVSDTGVKSLKSSIVMAHKMIPSALTSSYYMMFRPSPLGDKLLFIAVSTAAGVNSLILYCLTDIDNVQRIYLPFRVQPMDIIVRDSKAYVLGYVKEADNNYTNYVLYTSNGTNYGELFRFTQPTFVRSFEELNGNFYFGLGCSNDKISELSGTIIRVSK